MGESQTRMAFFAPAPPTPGVPSILLRGHISHTALTAHPTRGVHVHTPGEAYPLVMLLNFLTRLAKCHLAQKLRIHAYGELSFIKIDPTLI
jgi:hypothetical protein